MACGSGLSVLLSGTQEGSGIRSNTNRRQVIAMT